MICSIKKVLKNEKVCEDIYKISIEGNFEGNPGQFYMLKVPYKEPLLPRPISIYEVEDGRIQFLYKVVGEGTKLLCKLKEGDEIQVLGPLGNSFNLKDSSKKVAMVSGGIGIAPLMFLSRRLKNACIDFYAGFYNESYAVDNVEKNVNNLYISMEKERNGNKLQSCTQKSNIEVVYNSYITDIFRPEKYEIVYCCGPKVMMEKVVKMCKEKNVPVYVSMENKMACGIGACLGCTCETGDGYKRVCSDGPVFKGEEIIF
ncbi:dihydroorotate dehydrogenase electron transfer subunit [Haloimpatiens lingqiaonensis]|uniref:dihydroorotate dehydrogenase electron transfer subunit n=1 Tax=Haloimpatiens lingqiaonensis TaxID=1380675 RepID=UPI0010FF41B9|nr:dihydroorotate dehydrogenase electron transfer subunit [Haloimpatiens lingqiaonensis]